VTTSPLVRATVAAALASLSLTLVSCGDDEDSGAGGQETPPASPSASASASPSETASSTVAPATGPVLTMPNAQLNAPDGWKKTRSIVDYQVAAASPDFSDGVFFAAVELPSGGSALSLEEQMQTALESATDKPKPEPMDPVTIDGVEWWHLSSTGPDGGTDRYGVDHDGYETSITITFDGDDTAQEREDAVAGVLASFTWR